MTRLEQADHVSLSVVIFAVLGLAIASWPTLTPADATVATQDFTLECTQTDDVLDKQRPFATCTATGLNGFDQRIIISCSGMPESVDCRATWHPLLTPSKPTQTFEVHNRGYVTNSNNGTIATFNILATSEDGQIHHTAVVQVPLMAIFIIPESPIGIIALLASSVAALGGFMFWKRRSKPAPGMTGLGI
jgi:hypothetical protein